MSPGLILVWAALVISFSLASLSFFGVVSKWPKIFFISCVSNAAVLSLYYTPSLYGYHYYLVNILRTIPLILLLVHFAKLDPAPNWTYRWLCLVFILQIFVGAWHILAGLNSPYYDSLSITSTVAELLILIVGGFDARLTILGRRTGHMGGSVRCSVWAKRDQERRERSC